jgi:hypothetical protein
MKRKRRTKGIEFDEEMVADPPMLGAYGGFQEIPEDDRPLKPQIGFVRQTKEARKRKK